jgi:hypothetical protein
MKQRDLSDIQRGVHVPDSHFENRPVRRASCSEVRAPIVVRKPGPLYMMKMVGAAKGGQEGEWTDRRMTK